MKIWGTEWRNAVPWELSTFLFAHFTQYFSSALSSMYESLCCVCAVFFFFFWSIGTLQCCVNFCRTMKWISYLYTSIPPSSNSAHPTSLHHHKAPPVLYNRFPLVIYFPHGSVYLSILLSWFVPPYPSPTVSLLYVCVFAVFLKPLSVSLLLGYSSQEIHCGIKGETVWNTKTWGLPSSCHMT